MHNHCLSTHICPLIHNHCPSIAKVILHEPNTQGLPSHEDDQLPKGCPATKAIDRPGTALISKAIAYTNLKGGALVIRRPFSQ